VEASGSELVFAGGKFDVSARDICAAFFDKCVVMVYDAEIRLEGSSTARAMEIRGAFPWIQNCNFISAGSAKNSGVLYGTDAAAPLSGSITGNEFQGFARILGQAWPAEKIEDFNRSFASTEKPNTVVETIVPPAPLSFEIISDNPGGGKP
jgi:hypothetical protein